MADDLGYNDLGFQVSTNVKIPDLDKLAANGVVFTDAHTTASICSPSRTGFITGRYRQRFGHEANCPPKAKVMDTSEFTMGQAFQTLNYKTFMVGKWHLGDQDEYYPTNRGFDEFWGLREGSRSYFYNEEKSDKTHSKNFHKIEHNGQQVKFEGFLTDRMTDQAIRMINETEKPFFMFLSYTAPHDPLQATESDLQKAQNKPYWALIQNMDDNIGRLVKFLENKQIRKKTVIWFLSDNGGTCSTALNIPLNGKKGIKFEGGQRVPMLINCPGVIPAGKTITGLTSAMDIFPTSYALAGGKVTPKPLDGVDIQPFISGEKEGNPHDVLYWRKLEGAAIRSNDWKLIRSEGLPPMLYNLKNDLSERNNLAKTQPEKVSQLLKKLESWERIGQASVGRRQTIHQNQKRDVYQIS
ncbi:MAG: sulfatase-like hydrolase/transferase [Lentisphaerales bacterium]|nr:sulfatase-like hydrolase/transferase [Lentisphaerales bacterium]